MDEHERRALLDEFAKSRAQLVALVEGLTAEQWRFHPAEGRWSVGDCIEHVTAVEARVLGAICDQLERPPDPEKRSLSESKDAVIRQRIPDRSRRIEAPEPVRPKGSWEDPNRLLADFLAARDRTVEFTSSTQGDLRSHFFAHISWATSTAISGWSCSVCTAGVTLGKSRKSKRTLHSPPPSRQPHFLCFLMGRRPDRGERVRRDFPSLLPDCLLYRRSHRLGHLHYVAHKRRPIRGFRWPLAGRFDFQIKRRLLRAARGNIVPLLRDGWIILAAVPFRHF